VVLVVVVVVVLLLLLVLLLAVWVRQGPRLTHHPPGGDGSSTRAISGIRGASRALH
jgi:hypothetical protein